MGLLFIVDPLESFKIQGDTTLAMMRVAQEAGHRLWFCQSRNVLWRDDFIVADCQFLVIKPSSTAWFELGDVESRALKSFSAALMRTDPPFDIEYLNTTWLLSAAVRQGARVFNDPSAVRDHSEKLSILEFPKLIPPTLVTREFSAVERHHQTHGDIVIKPLDGMGAWAYLELVSMALILPVLLRHLEKMAQER